MRRFWSLAGLVAVVLTTAVAPSPAQAVPAVSVVVVPAQDPVQYTSFATVADVDYLIMVTGIYNPNVDVPDLDCGWGFGAGGTPWGTNSLVTVDGHAAECRSLPYSPAHTYQWSERGTGAPFRLSINDYHPWMPAGSGGLTFVVTGPRAKVPHTVSSFCFPHREPTSLLDYVPVVVETGAQAGADGATPQSTSIDCSVTTTSGETAELQLGLVGPLVETAARMTVPPGDTITVCWQGSATWDDGVTVTQSQRCQYFSA